jgi:hypothetical protein
MENTKSRVNQRVLIRNTSSLIFDGQRGIITEIGPSKHPRDYVVQVDAGESVQFNEHELDLTAD